MSTGLKKVDGVEKVNVSLNKGIASIQLKPQNTVTLANLREVIKKNGFAPKGGTVRVAGKIESAGDSLQLIVAGSNEKLVVLNPNEHNLRNHRNASVVMLGEINFESQASPAIKATKISSVP